MTIYQHPKFEERKAQAYKAAEAVPCTCGSFPGPHLFGCPRLAFLAEECREFAVEVKR